MKLAWKDGERVRAFELAPLGPGRWRVTLDGVEVEITAAALPDGRLRIETPAGATVARITAVGARRFVRIGALDFVLDREVAGARGATPAGGGLDSPMPGVVTRVLVAPGDAVKKGQPLVALEAMKMEHVLRAPHDGTIRRIAARVGDMVGGGVALVEMEGGPSA